MLHFLLFKVVLPSLSWLNIPTIELNLHGSLFNLSDGPNASVMLKGLLEATNPQRIFTLQSEVVKGIDSALKYFLNMCLKQYNTRIQ